MCYVLVQIKLVQDSQNWDKDIYMNHKTNTARNDTTFIMANNMMFVLIFICIHLVSSNPVDVCETPLTRESYMELAELYIQGSKESTIEDGFNEVNTNDESLDQYCSKLNQTWTCCKEPLQQIENAHQCVFNLVYSTDEIKNQCVDIEDEDILNYFMQIFIKDTTTFEQLLNNGELYLNNAQKIALYNAMSMKTIKGDYESVNKLFGRVQNLIEEKPDNFTLWDIKSLNDSLYTIAYQSLVHKIDGTYHPQLWFKLLQGPFRLLGYLVSRDTYIYIAEKTENGTILTNDFLNQLVDISVSILENMHGEEVKEPVSGLLSQIIFLCQHSTEFEMLDKSVTTLLKEVYANLNDFVRILFTHGEFCVNVEQFWEQDYEYNSDIPVVILRNAGTMGDPDYNWYLWTNDPNGQVLRLADKKIAVLAPNGQYDVNSTIYKNLIPHKGGFLKLRKDLCVDNYDEVTKYLCLPLNEMMLIFKESNVPGFDFVRRFGCNTSESCVRLSFQKTIADVVDNNI